mmetsp:Transcript_75158/g.217279  ORF Transcript_75158/g.217279 Transcript_75158/m.217279 type:complete len:92 (+) Transcript_75158:138-413(+)
MDHGLSSLTLSGSRASRAPAATLYLQVLTLVCFLAMAQLAFASTPEVVDVCISAGDVAPKEQAMSWASFLVVFLAGAMGNYLNVGASMAVL